MTKNASRSGCKLPSALKEVGQPARGKSHPTSSTRGYVMQATQDLCQAQLYRSVYVLMRSVQQLDDFTQNKTSRPTKRSTSTYCHQMAAVQSCKPKRGANHVKAI